MEPEYCSLRREWPGGDTIVTAFRYMLATPFAKDKKVLDLGCGAGEGAPLFATDAAEYVGLDHAAAWKESPVPAGLPRGATFVEGDACDLPADWNGRFDLVVALELIEHLKTPETMLQEIRRVLAPDGVAILSTPNFNLLSRACDRSRHPLYQHHVREYTAAGFRKVLAAFGAPSQITGLSQLAPGSPSAEKVTLALGDTVVHLCVGPAYPEMRIDRAESLPTEIAAEDYQSFVALLGIDRPLTAPRAATRKSRMSVDRVAVKSFEWILRRRNEQVRQMQGRLENLESHCRDQEEIIAKQAGHVANLERIVATRDMEIKRAVEAEIDEIKDLKTTLHLREKHTEKLKEMVANRQEHARSLEAIVAARNAQIKSMKKHAPPVGEGEIVPKTR